MDYFPGFSWALSSSFTIIKNYFNLKRLKEGEWEQSNFKISIADVKSSDDPYNPYGTFTVELTNGKR